jgi:molecular chaperone IbpA
MMIHRIDHAFADAEKLAKYFVGFDKFNEKMTSIHTDTMKALTSAYPPFNIKKTDENTYVIELAVAGFGKQDIEVVMEDGKLVIKGNTFPDSGPASYIHKGIADRAFTRTFNLADNIEIKNAHMFNGLLKVWLEHIIPEDKKPKKIPVTDAEPTKSAEFLAEKTK